MPPKALPRSPKGGAPHRLETTALDSERSVLVNLLPWPFLPMTGSSLVSCKLQLDTHTLQVKLIKVSNLGRCLQNWKNLVMQINKRTESVRFQNKQDSNFSAYGLVSELMVIIRFYYFYTSTQANVSRQWQLQNIDLKFDILWRGSSGRAQKVNGQGQQEHLSYFSHSTDEFTFARCLKN